MHSFLVILGIVLGIVVGAFLLLVVVITIRLLLEDHCPNLLYKIHLWECRVLEFFRHKGIESTAQFKRKKKTVYYKVPVDDLGFTPNTKEVVYVEPTFHNTYNQLMRKHWEEIDKAFKARLPQGLVYLPKFKEQLDEKLLIEKVIYNFPRVNKTERGLSLGYEDIQKMYQLPPLEGPCLVRCYKTNQEFDLDDSNDGYAHFSICYLESKNWRQLKKELGFYLGHLYTHNRFFALASKEYMERYYKDMSADDRFDYDIKEIGKEIRQRIELLESKGMDELAIRRLIGDIDEDPSSLYIDKRNRILLPEFHNREIKLSPLHKAVYFLFLKHPEGICFKDLKEYEEELYNIYSVLTNVDDPKKVKKSIEQLTNPLDNSINEKCARIKNAFVSAFSNKVAQWYYIDGEPGEKKRIRLPKDMIHWEENR